MALETPCGVAYQIEGDGPELVILRGLGRNIRHWLGFEKILAKSFKVIAIDARGLGKTRKKMTVNTGIWDLADDVVQVMDHAGIKSAHILGVSLGGMVTLALGVRHRERCNSLIVVNTSIGGLGKIRIHPKVILTLGKKGLINDPKLEYHLIDFLIGGDCTAERRQEIARLNAEIHHTEPSPVLTVMRQLVAAVRFKPAKELKALRIPTLVIYGADDRFVPNGNSRAIAGLIPNSKLLKINGGGHEIGVDKPEILERELVEWVAARIKPAG